ncbi:KpsF/GutQ family sugar-phosphate isomerase [bacterium]|nr:KpsF/GutQ family sugar-phosphate isomerase [bacterium]
MSIEKGKEVIRIEAEAVKALESRIDERFERAVAILLACEGRVIVTGMGKSGIIGQKIAAMLTSTGTAALFLHPAEGLHGDLGAVMPDDVVICISKSGTTEEIMRIMPMFRRQNVPVITMTGNVKSVLAERSDVVLDVSVKEEACPWDLVPTASTTATLVMGDALALALFQERGFSIEEFATFHPGGDIGRRLLLTVDDVMRSGDDVPIIGLETLLTEAVLVISSKRLGATCVVDDAGALLGIITDGDLRRLMELRQNIWDLRAEDVMTKEPKTVQSGVLAAKALHVMESHSINALIVLDDQGKPVGMVHIHDLIKAGLA